VNITLIIHKNKIEFFYPNFFSIRLKKKMSTFESCKSIKVESCKHIEDEPRKPIKGLDTITLAIAHTEFRNKHAERYVAVMGDYWDCMTFSDITLSYAKNPNLSINQLRTQFGNEYAELVLAYLAEIKKACEPSQ